MTFVDREVAAAGIDSFAPLPRSFACEGTSVAVEVIVSAMLKGVSRGGISRGTGGVARVEYFEY